MTFPRRRPYFEKSILYYPRLLLTNQPKTSVEILEKKLTQSLQLPNPVVVASGRIGLRLLLDTSGLKPKAEIIMPGFTFGLLTKSISASGFIPKPVDINPNTFEMSPRKVEAAITKETGAILATHLFGEPCDIYKLKAIARKHELLLIEDCAQSLGADSQGKMTGTIGDVGFSSFNISKPLQGITGGVVFSKNKRWMGKIREKVRKSNAKMSDFSKEISREMLGYFLTQTPIWFIFMYLFSFEALQEKFVYFYRRGESSKSSPAISDKLKNLSLPPALANIVMSNLPSLQKRLEKRRKLRRYYHSLLKDDLTFQKINPKDKGSVYILVATAFCNTFKLRRYLAIRGIDIAIGDEIANDCLKESGSSAASVFRKAISLPMYEGLRRGDILYISRAIKNFLKRERSS
jgi:dTDP-4-amino-4,6-dideoxygalactose transaminase